MLSFSVTREDSDADLFLEEVQLVEDRSGISVSQIAALKSTAYPYELDFQNREEEKKIFDSFCELFVKDGSEFKDEGAFTASFVSYVVNPLVHKFDLKRKVLKFDFNAAVDCAIYQDNVLRIIIEAKASAAETGQKKGPIPIGPSVRLSVGLCPHTRAALRHRPECRDADICRPCCRIWQDRERQGRQDQTPTGQQRAEIRPAALFLPLPPPRFAPGSLSPFARRALIDLTAISTDRRDDKAHLDVDDDLPLVSIHVDARAPQDVAKLDQDRVKRMQQRNKISDEEDEDEQ